MAGQMTNKAQMIFAAMVLAANAPLSAQDSTGSRALFGEGLALQGGIGYAAVRDEYISSEKYSSGIQYVGVSWSASHETYAFRMHMEYQSTSNLKNYNVSARMIQFRMGFDYLYPLSEITVLSKKVMISLGPTAELFEYHREQNIAGSEGLRSNVALLSGDIRLEAVCPLTAALRLRAAAQLSLLSLGARTVHAENGDDTPVSVLTPAKGLDATGEIALSWRLMESLFATAGYRFDVTRVSAWDFFVSANDNVLLSLSYGF